MAYSKGTGTVFNPYAKTNRSNDATVRKLPPVGKYDDAMTYAQKASMGPTTPEPRLTVNRKVGRNKATK